MDKKKLDEQYNKLSKDFLNKAREGDMTDMDTFRKIIDFPVKGKKILDLGCGDGTELLALHEKGAEVWGIDTSKEMINAAKKMNPKGNFTLGSFESTPYEDNSFDAIISKHALQMTYDIAPVLEEVVRILRGGGYFIYLTVHPFRQFIEKKKKPKGYFEREVVESRLFNETIVVKEPTHTMNEYLSDFFFEKFEMISYEEKVAYGAEKIGGDTYPGLFIIKARKK